MSDNITQIEHTNYASSTLIAIHFTLLPLSCPALSISYAGVAGGELYLPNKQH